MSVKIDTKEKFSVIIPETSEISANMSDELKELLNSYLNHSIPHVILSLRNVKKMDHKVAEMILNIQVGFYEKNYSFVICETLKELMFLFENSVNITPTESEAWDIIQMEEIERELLNDFD
jgi:anti-anti-sigma regulatory factor